MSKSDGNNRSALLASIEHGKKLKSAKHLMVDKSGPAVAGVCSVHFLSPPAFLFVLLILPFVPS